MQKNTMPAAFCLALSLGFRIHEHMVGRAVEVNVLLEPILIAWAAFLLPVMVPVVTVERLLFHFSAWDSGHTGTTIFYMTVAAVLFWFFPTVRIERWFGVFNPFREGKRRLPSLTRPAAAVLDTLNRLKVGKGKTGGWA